MGPAAMPGLAAALVLCLIAPFGTAQVSAEHSHEHSRSPAARSEDATIAALQEGAKQIEKLGLKHDLDTCAPRTPTPPVSRAERDGTSSDLGVILTVCDETLEVLEEIGCKDGKVQYYLYSVCGLSRKEVTRRAKGVSECLKKVREAPLMLYSELSQTHGNTEFLTHILQNYEELEQNLVFVKGSEATSLEEAVDAALSGKWAYKPLWPLKAAISYEHLPAPGTLERYATELCTLHKRFTCESDCHSCSHSNSWTDDGAARADLQVVVDECSYTAPRSSFITTAARVRSLPLFEYSWTREWLQSWQEDEQGALHRALGDRLWPLMLGCPEDLHSNISDSGCINEMMFPADGRRLKPPDEFIDLGLIHFPPPTFKHENSHPYPHLASPKYKHSRDITFVVSVGAHIPVNINLNELLKALVGQIVYFHPSAHVVALVRSEVMVAIKGQITWRWFAGRLELLEIETEHEMGNFGVMHSAIETDEEVRDWVRVNWMQSYSFEMRQQYLRMLADGQIRREDLEDAETHHAFISLNTVLLDDLWPAFQDEDGREGEPFALGVPIRPLPGHAVDSSIMLVHKDRIEEAADILDELLNNHLMHGGYRGSFDQALQERFLDCLGDNWWSNAQAQTVSCSESAARAAGKIKLLPASMWNGIVMKGGNGASPWLMQEWAASLADEGARAMRLVLYGSGTFIHSDMEAIFKSTRERHDAGARQVAAFQNANLTLHHDSALKESALAGAIAGADTALNAADDAKASPRHLASPTEYYHRPLKARSPRHMLSGRSQLDRASPGRRVLASPHHLASSGSRHAWHHHTVSAADLPFPELGSKSPEEDLFNFDDPLMDHMYEVQNPKRPTKEAIAREIAEERSRRPGLIPKNKQPRFPRSMHNRQYMEKLEAFRPHYAKLLKRPSPLQKASQQQQQEEEENPEEDEGQQQDGDDQRHEQQGAGVERRGGLLKMLFRG